MADNPVVLDPDIDDNFAPNLNKIKDRTKALNRSSEKGIVNEKTGSSIVVRDSGDINLAATEQAQYKLGVDGKATEISMESTVVANRRNVIADDVVVNNHKLNPQVYELADFKQIMGSPDKVAGNFTIMGTILVKAWEPNLKRYVLIRRQCRVPLFSPIINVPQIPTGLKCSDASTLSQAKDFTATQSSNVQIISTGTNSQ